MKKKISIIILLLVLFSIIMPSHIYGVSGDLDNVTDAAGLLSENERLDLDKKAAELSELYECDIIVITVEDKGEMHIETFAQAVYDEYDLGYGGDNSGIMLIISMAERDYDIMAHGYGNIAFTDYGKKKLGKEFLPDLSDGNYYESFSIFIDSCGRYLKLARDGKPIDVDSDPDKANRIAAIVALVLPLLLTVTTGYVLKKQMKSTKIQTKAKEYVKEGSFNLKNQKDEYLHTVTTQRKIKSESSGGTSVNSNGSSHSSGKF